VFILLDLVSCYSISPVDQMSPSPRAYRQRVLDFTIEVCERAGEIVRGAWGQGNGRGEVKDTKVCEKSSPLVSSVY
jgi:hypothetical protein